MAHPVSHRICRNPDSVQLRTNPEYQRSAPSETAPKTTPKIRKAHVLPGEATLPGGFLQFSRFYPNLVLLRFIIPHPSDTDYVGLRSWLHGHFSEQVLDSLPAFPSKTQNLPWALSVFLFFFKKKAEAFPRGCERSSSHWTGQQAIISSCVHEIQGLEHQASQASFFTSLSWSEDQSIKEGLALTWDLCDWLIYCGNGRPFIYGNI